MLKKNQAACDINFVSIQFDQSIFFILEVMVNNSLLFCLHNFPFFLIFDQ